MLRQHTASSYVSKLWCLYRAKYTSKFFLSQHSNKRPQFYMRVFLLTILIFLFHWKIRITIMLCRIWVSWPVSLVNYPHHLFHIHYKIKGNRIMGGIEHDLYSNLLEIVKNNQVQQTLFVLPNGFSAFVVDHFN